MTGYCYKSCDVCSTIAPNWQDPFTIGDLIDPLVDESARNLWGVLKTQFGTRIFSGQSENANASSGNDRDTGERNFCGGSDGIGDVGGF